ncbi:MAG: PQQ-dependent sugar dehydrogenase [Pseudomonadota bacterium]
MRHRLATVCLLALAIGSYTKAWADIPGFAAAEPIPASTYTVETIAEGFEIPWDIAFLPGGDMLVTERGGTLRLVRDGVLVDAPLEGVPDVFVKSQAGLFEVQPHPEFTDNGWLYLTYAHGTNSRNTLRLARAKYVATADGARLDDLEVLFEADAYRRTSEHYGGRFVFLGDSTLLLTCGDGYAYRHDAQRLNSHFGKILRLTDTGEAPADNPFVDTPDALPEIWSFGHRNHQGIALGADGTVFSNEHGALGGDEINIIEAGGNYGWPLESWGADYSGAQITPYTDVDGTVDPIFYWTPSIAPGALAYVDGEPFADWNGQLLSTGLATREVRVADPNTPAAEQASVLTDLDARLRDVTMGPDGLIYVSTEGENGGQVLRLRPAE